MCRELLADEIECRVAQVTENGCSLLLYKTARVDRAILTEMYGNLWQNDFKVIDGKMYGGIGIYDRELKEWLWRWDCGTESNTEAEKGQASDCFKRAGFKWGIGIELYTTPFIFVNAGTVKFDNKYKLKDKLAKYRVLEIGYENRNINKLIIVDREGNKVFELGKYIKPTPKSPVEKAVEKPAPKPTQKTTTKKTTGDNLTPEEKQAIEDSDRDIFEGLKGCGDLENLKIYYREQYKNVHDKKAFEKLKDEMKSKLYV